ncbi:cupin domain-containing protein [Arthrobacter sp. S39]|uniref:cupin domain-containing protein n=1 Tax=Arthrobacter sp. S39 TaxID=2509720 RepID=UPI0010377B48|nr:cupin domain-containing protein [Arthrobacter sp. S39]TAP43187.1 cupin domain-containing protein [Arthrobacter sp. S39]
MHSTHIDAIKGTDFDAPYRRTIKHLHTPWGTGAAHLWMGMSEVPEASESNPHIHEDQEESFFIHEGTGEVVVEGKAIKVHPGSLVVIAPGELHQLRNTGSGTMRVLCAVAPPFTLDDFETVHDPEA